VIFNNVIFIILIANTEPLLTVPSTASLVSSGSVSNTGPPHHGIEQLALNMGFGGIRPNLANPSSSSIATISNLSTTTPSSSTSLVNSANPVSQLELTSSSSQQALDLTDDVSFNREISNETEDDVKKHVITKIDPVEMVATPSVITVSKDPVRRAAVLLAGPKFQLNYNEIPKDKLTINSNTLYSVAVSLIIRLSIKYI
jgi:hypothetical protein